MKYMLWGLIFIVTVSVMIQASEERGLHIATIKDQAGQEVGLYQESHALVIGVSDYTGGWPDLPGVKKDVQIVKAALEEQGFRVTMVEDSTRPQLEHAFNDFITQYGQAPDNRLLFYFAGHGHTLKLSYGEEMGYIVPTDAPNPYNDKFGFLAKAIDMQMIEVYAKRIQAKHALFLFDSCFSGSIFALSRAVPESISYKTAKPVRQFLTSGSAEEQVPDESIFRQQFIVALQGEADTNADGYITGSELGEFLQDKVTKYSKGAQHPQYGKIRNPNLDKGDFVSPLSVTIPVGEQPQLESSPVPVQEVDPETAMWKLIEPSEDISDVQDFLAAFPDGKFAKVAQLKLKQLERQQRQEERAVSPMPLPTATPHPPTPSFDCAKATTEIEKSICNNKELSAIDGQLGKVYSKLRKLLPKSEATNLKKEQRIWLKMRDSTCPPYDIECLLSLYKERLTVLNIDFREHEKRHNNTQR